MGDFGIGGNLQRKEQELGGFGIPKALPNPRGAREGPKSIFGPPEKAILGLSKPFPIPALGPFPVPAALPGARKGFSDRPKMHFGIPRTLPSPRGAPGGPKSIFGPPGNAFLGGPRALRNSRGAPPGPKSIFRPPEHAFWNPQRLS